MNRIAEGSIENPLSLNKRGPSTEFHMEIGPRASKGQARKITSLDESADRVFGVSATPPDPSMVR